MDKRDHWNARYKDKALRWSAGPNELFAAIAQELAPGTALDVASGEGRTALWLAEQGWRVDAIDFSDVGIDKGRKMAAQRDVSVNWIVGDVSDYPFQRMHYDVVAVIYLHTSEIERAAWLPRVIQAVRPGGSFIYIAHDPSNIEKGVGGPQDLALLPSIEALEPFLDGFEFRRAEVYERAVDGDPGHGGALTGVALDTLIWAVRPFEC